MGTAQILNQINDGTEFNPPLIWKINDGTEFNPPLIWNSAFIVSAKTYQYVESIFRYGCNICQGFGRDLDHEKYSNQLVCDSFLDSLLSTEENKRLSDITKTVST